MPRIQWPTPIALFVLSSFCLAAPVLQAQQPSVSVERSEYDMRKLVAPSKLTETELEGRRLLVQRCAYCHDQGGRSMAPWLDRERISTTGEQNFREKILKGSRTMPGWQYALEPVQIDQIMAFLKTVTPDQRPAPPPRP